MKLEAKRLRTGDKIISLFVGIAIFVGVLICLSFIVTFVPRPKPPLFVARSIPDGEDSSSIGSNSFTKPEQLAYQPEVTIVQPSVVDVITSSTIPSIPINSFEPLELEEIAFDKFSESPSQFKRANAVGDGGGMFGSSKSSRLTGRFYDLKQDRFRKELDYGSNFNRRIEIAKDAIKKISAMNYSSEAFKDWYQVEQKLDFTYLAIPSVQAVEGPKVFNVDRDVQPTGWLVHYTGTISAPSSGEWRFAGAFDDILIVRINGKTVFESSFGFYDSSWLPDDSTKHESPFKRFISYGNWVSIENARIDILIGEVPGLYVGGTLLIQKKGEQYEEQNGRPILPLFSVVKLSQKDWERLEGDGLGEFRYSKDEVPFLTH